MPPSASARHAPATRRGRPRLRAAASALSTEEQILRAAGELFAEKGFAGTSTRDIARRVGLRQPSLYHHFPNTAAMLATLIERAGRGSLDIFEALDRLDAPPEIRFYRAVYLESRMLAGWPDWLKVVCQLPELRQPRHLHFIAIRDRIVAWYQGVIAAGVAAGAFRPMEPRFAGWLVNGLNEAIFDLAPSTPRLEPERHARRVAEFAAAAVLADPAGLPGLRRAADALDG